MVGMLEVLGSFRAEWKGLDSDTRLPQVSSLEVKKERSAALSLEAREVIKSGPDEDGKSSCILGAFVPVICASLATTYRTETCQTHSFSLWR